MDNEERACDISREDQCPAVELCLCSCQIKLCPVSFMCADIIAAYKARAKYQKPVSFHHLSSRPPGHDRWQILCP